MSIEELLIELKDAQISLAIDGESLVVTASKGTITESIKSSLANNKEKLIAILKSDSLISNSEVAIPPNLIETETAVITPEMLPLIDLTQEDIDHIVEEVPGGVSNIQDIYALTPLQDGILFHHLLASQGDPYLLIRQMGFPDRNTLDRFLAAVQELVDRHDIFNLTQAPLLQFAIAHDPERDRWVLLQRLHHLVGDHSTLDVLLSELYVFLAGEGHTLGLLPPFRNLVAQVRLGVSAEEHERFFREMLGEVSEPTLPFGLSDVHQDGGDIDESSSGRCCLDVCKEVKVPIDR